jgi:hypothetical protein
MLKYLLICLCIAGSVLADASVVVQNGRAINNFQTKYQLSGTGSTFTNSGVGALNASANAVNQAQWSTGVTFLGRPTILFDGTDDYIKSGNRGDYDFLVNGTESFTVHGWFYDTNTAGGYGHSFFSYGKNTNTAAGFGGLVMSGYTGAKLSLVIRNHDAGTRTISMEPASLTYTASVWNHLMWTYDVNTGKHSMFLNGIKETTVGGIATGAYSSTSPPEPTFQGAEWDGTFDMIGNLHGWQIVRGRVLSYSNFNPYELQNN